MMKCEDVQRELSGFISHDMDGDTENEIRGHLESCPGCARVLRQMTRLSDVLQSWKGTELSPAASERLRSGLIAKGTTRRKIFSASFVRKAAFRFAEVAAVVTVTLLVSRQFQKPAPQPGPEPSPINFYLVEHQQAAAQTVPAGLSDRPAARIPIDREDFLYYELIDEFPGAARPGFILKGRDSRSETTPPQAAPSEKEELITLEQALKTVNFPLIAPLRLHPGYILDSIRKITGRNCLHLVYTNGIDTLSLFEQPASGDKGLGVKDFREYAVYRSIEPIPGQPNGQSRVTILAWINKGVSLVLIGKGDLSKLMETGQVISEAEPTNAERPE